ncbi:MAG: hypothetical protein V8Q77_05515 [Bacilli bacterium]
MKKILSAIAIMALMIVFASCTNSRKDGGGSLYEPDNGMIEDGTSSQFDYEFVHNWGDQFLGENYNRIVENQYVYTNKQQEAIFQWILLLLLIQIYVDTLIIKQKYLMMR